MAKKRRKKTKKKTSKGFRITAFFICCVAVLGAFFYWLHHVSGPRSTAYEEIFPKSSELKTRISNIDNAVYESLYSEGIDEKDIYFSDIATVNSGGYEWDFTELTVRVQDRKTALRLVDAITNELLALKPDVEAYREAASDSDELVFNVFSLDLYTHRIRFSYTGTWKQPYKDLPKIAIVIDDFGDDYGLATSFMDIGFPITMSILPSSTHAKKIAEKAVENGFEVILHLPMEPKNYPDVYPGPDALLTSMDEKEILGLIDKNLEKIPGVYGINNHMGSCFTEQEDKMTYVLKELKKRDLFYLDSRTTSNSVGFRLAGEIGVPTAERDVFLDNDQSYKAVKYQMDRLIGIARYSGEAIGIGHPHDVTLEILREYAGVLKTDYNMVPVSQLVKQQ
ncbi:MAG: divergent polysaccharide deacetylase family protein [Deltaproteobacteria bacterium]|nr:divergent polysaccharide deacetylase family protein [Deltaproteobacteria bacterium]